MIVVAYGLEQFSTREQLNKRIRQLEDQYSATLGKKRSIEAELRRAQLVTVMEGLNKLHAEFDKLARLNFEAGWGPCCTEAPELERLDDEQIIDPYIEEDGCVVLECASGFRVRFLADPSVPVGKIMFQFSESRRGR